MSATAELTNEQLYDRNLFGRLARKDLIIFSVINTPDPLDQFNCRKSKYQWMPHHYLIADRLQKVEAGEIQNLEIETPPRIGKSECAVRNFVTWHAGRHPDRDLLIITATYELAQEHGRDVRDYFNGHGYQLAFGNNPKAKLRSDSQSLDRLQLVGGAKIQFYGRGGIPAGVGGYGIIFDDFFKSAEEANSETEREKAWRCYVADCLSRLNYASSWQVIIGSRKNEDDIQGRLFDPSNVHYDEATAKKFVRLRIPALSEGRDIDPLGREKDEVFWPERFPRAFYISKRDHKSDIVRMDFQTQDQCNPRPTEGKHFKEHWFKHYEHLPSNLTNYVASDHAYRIKDVNDKSVILKAHMSESGDIYISPKTFWDRVETDVLADEFFATIKDFKPSQWWAARDGISGSILPFLKRRMINESVFFYIDDTITESRDLLQRSASFRGMMAMGKIHWPIGWPQLENAKAQLLSFPGKQDDLVAACAMLGMGLAKMVRPEPDFKPKDYLAKPMTMAWVKQGQDLEKARNKVNKAISGW